MAERKKSFTYGRNFTFIAVVALLFVYSYGFSLDKEHDINDYNFGIHAGITYPTVQNTVLYTVYPDTPAMGFFGGLSANCYFIKNLLAIQVELNYVMLSASQSISELDSYGTLPPVKTSVKWNFIQLPILLKLSAPWKFPVKPYIIAGLSKEAELVGLNDVYSMSSLIGAAGVDYLLDNGYEVSLEFRAVITTNTSVDPSAPGTYFTAFAGFSI